MDSSPVVKPLVYIVLLNWNTWQDTIKCLDSLTHLEYLNCRIIVIDNGSTNDSVAQIRSAFHQADIIETGTNRGFSGGCNVGIRHALEEGASYVWLLNNDTIVGPHALGAMVELAESDERIGGVGSVLYWMNEPNRLQVWGGGWVSFLTGRSGHYYSPVPISQLHYVTGASLLLRRNALEDVCLLDDNTFFMYWEDVDLCFRLRKRGWRLAVAENSIILHKQAASSEPGSPKLAFYSAQSSYRFFLRHSPFPLWTIVVGTSGRLSKRFLRLRMDHVWAIIRGTYSGVSRAHELQGTSR